MFKEPNNTPYDLCFKVAGIPVRVHPLFWVLSAIMGSSSGDPLLVIIWVAVVFVSILIHELGHAVVMRWYGDSPRISLYMMGGLAIPGNKNPWGNQQLGNSTSQQIIISFAGPAAGFIFAGIVAGVVYLYGGRIEIPEGSLYLVPRFPFQMDDKLWFLIFSTLLVNTFWGLVNLLPVYPLDGGLISRAVFTHVNPHDGIRQSLWVSVVAGALAAVAGLVVFEQIFMAILFGFLAFSSFQAVQNISRGGFGGSGGNPW